VNRWFGPCCRGCLALGLIGMASSSCDRRFDFDSPAVVDAASGSGGSAGSGGGASGAGAAPTTGGSMSGGAGASGGTAGYDGTCTDDRQCGLPSLHCDTGSGRCVECLSNDQCGPPNPACDVAAHRCVPCLLASDCGRDEACDPSLHKCQRTCTEDSNCPSPSVGCNKKRGTCQGCDLDGDDDDCVAPAQCQLPIEVCVECLQDAQCGGITPICDLPTGRCVACVDSRDCSGLTPFCVPTSHVCSAATHSG